MLGISGDDYDILTLAYGLIQQFMGAMPIRRILTLSIRNLAKNWEQN
jgi:hypothetical protein